MKKAKKGLRLLLLLLAALVLLAAAGFAYLYFNGLSGLVRIGVPAADQLRVACVGDSVTYGHGIGNWPKNNYPAVLQELLGEEYHVGNFGFSGRAVQRDSDQPYTATARYQKSLAYDCDILIFMMGSNDSKPENWKGAEPFAQELRSLLDSYVRGKDAPRLVLCTPPATFFTGDAEGPRTNFDIQPAVVDEIAEIVRAAAEEYDCVLLDIHALTQTHPEWFAKDGVHPDRDGARAIAQAAADAITQGLSSRS